MAKVKSMTRRELIQGAALGLCVASLLSGCNNDQPTPNNPITYTGIPREVIEIKGHWKMGDYTQGFRIRFDDYYAITDSQGLVGQEGMAFAGPGMVKANTVESFRRIADLCTLIKDKENITLHGNLAKNENGKDYLFEGKKVIVLYDATYNGQNMEVNRRPWDN